MSNIKINKIESKTTDQNLAVTPNGNNGALEVSGDNDAAILLKDSQNTNGVKVQAPPSSAAQDYTLILPDTDLVQDRYLAVDSITGSGSTAVGQLRSATVSPPDLSNLNASNLTSGTVPDARYSVTASSGAGWKLINKTTVSANSHYVYFTGLDSNAMYLFVGQDVKMTGNGWLNVNFLESNGTSTVNDQYYNRVNGRSNYNSTYGPGSTVEVNVGTNVNRMNFIMEFCTGAPNSSTQRAQVSWYQLRAMDRDGSSHRCKIFGAVQDSYHENANTRFYGVRFGAYYQIATGAVFTLYKFQES